MIAKCGKLMLVVCGTFLVDFSAGVQLRSRTPSVLDWLLLSCRCRSRRTLPRGRPGTPAAWGEYRERYEKQYFRARRQARPEEPREEAAEEVTVHVTEEAAAHED